MNLLNPFESQNSQATSAPVNQFWTTLYELSKAPLIKVKSQKSQILAIRLLISTNVDKTLAKSKQKNTKLVLLSLMQLQKTKNLNKKNRKKKKKKNNNKATKTTNIIYTIPFSFPNTISNLKEFNLINLRNRSRPEKARGFKKLRTNKNVGQLRSFIGLAGY